MAALYTEGRWYELDDNVKLFLVLRILKNWWPFVITPYWGMESPFPSANDDFRTFYRYVGSKIWKVSFDDVEVMPDELPALSTAEALAIAVLKGDRIAALALADKVMEENR